MTREGKWTIGILLLVLAVVWLIPEEDASNAENLAKLTQSAEQKAAKIKKDKLNEKVTIERPVNGRVEIKGLKIAKENIELRNPFTYRHETRNEKISSGISPVDTGSKPMSENVVAPMPTGANSAPQQKSAARWELRGIIISDDYKQAILSRGEENVTLNPGDTFDGNVVLDITKDELIYEGQSGRDSLKISGQ
ncbi:MAG: hypothetical protein IKN12_01275 [Selenomonadaceae bacterium]|nr:hypothetical protein [Selenomonadaceae bacterium]